METSSQVKPALWGAVGGAILTLILGFYWGGWQTTNSASKMAKEQSDQKVIAARASRLPMSVTHAASNFRAPTTQNP
jgi:hypothetical protein